MNSAPVSRCIAGCVYLGKEAEIFPSAFSVLALSTVISGTVMLLLCTGAYHSSYEVSMTFLVSYYFLGVLAANAYALTIYASALKHHKELTLSFFLGLLWKHSTSFCCAETASGVIPLLHERNAFYQTFGGSWEELVTMYPYALQGNGPDFRKSGLFAAGDPELF